MFYLVLLSQAAPNKLSKIHSTCVNVKSEMNSMSIVSHVTNYGMGEKEREKKNRSL